MLVSVGAEPTEMLFCAAFFGATLCGRKRFRLSEKSVLHFARMPQVQHFLQIRSIQSTTHVKIWHHLSKQMQKNVLNMVQRAFAETQLNNLILWSWANILGPK